MTTPTEKGIGRLVNQFKDSTKLIGFLESFLVEFNSLQISELQLLNERYLDTAIGVQLDGIGEIVGLSRPVESIDVVGAFGFYDDATALGFTTLSNLLQGGNFVNFDSLLQPIGDDLYRLLLRAKIIENQTSMTVDETTYLISFTFGNVSVKYIPVSLNPIYEINKTLNEFEASLVTSFPILIGLDNVTYKMVSDTTPFGFDDDDSALGFASINEPSTNLLNYLPMSDGSGLVSQDVSSYRNDGVLFNAMEWDYQDNGLLWAKFNGIDNKITIPASVPITTLGAGSFWVSWVMAWQQSNDAFERIFECWFDSSNEFRLSVSLNDSAINFHEEVGGSSHTNSFVGSVALFDGQKHSCVFVWDQALKQIRLYDNTVAFAPRSIATWDSDISNGGAFSWGGKIATTANSFKGHLGQCRIYNGVPTQDEIDFLHNYPAGTYGGNFSRIII